MEDIFGDCVVTGEDDTIGYPKWDEDDAEDINYNTDEEKTGDEVLIWVRTSSSLLAGSNFAGVEGVCPKMLRLYLLNTLNKSYDISQYFITCYVPALQLYQLFKMFKLTKLLCLCDRHKLGALAFLNFAVPVYEACLLFWI